MFLRLELRVAGGHWLRTPSLVLLQQLARFARPAARQDFWSRGLLEKRTVGSIEYGYRQHYLLVPEGPRLHPLGIIASTGAVNQWLGAVVRHYVYYCFCSALISQREFRMPTESHGHEKHCNSVNLSPGTSLSCRPGTSDFVLLSLLIVDAIYRGNGQNFSQRNNHAHVLWFFLSVLT